MLLSPWTSHTCLRPIGCPRSICLTRVLECSRTVIGMFEFTVKHKVMVMESTSQVRYTVAVRSYNQTSQENVQTSKGTRKAAWELLCTHLTVIIISLYSCSLNPRTQTKASQAQGKNTYFVIFRPWTTNRAFSFDATLQKAPFGETVLIIVQSEHYIFEKDWELVVANESLLSKCVIPS